MLWELNEAAGAIAQHTPHEQRDFYYDRVASAASAFPVMSIRNCKILLWWVYIPSHSFWGRVGSVLAVTSHHHFWGLATPLPSASGRIRNVCNPQYRELRTGPTPKIINFIYSAYRLVLNISVTLSCLPSLFW